MANELTFTARGAGRIPNVAQYQIGGSGRALKVKFGRFVTGTSEYPADGYAAADIESITGMTRVVAVVPCGMASNGSHEKGFPVGWDGTTRTLRLYGITVVTGNAQTGGTIAAMSIVALNDAVSDAATFDAMVIGY